MLNPTTGKKWKVLVAIPSTGTVSDFQPYVLRRLEEDYSEEVELVYPPRLNQRIFHDYARNGLVDDFLESDCDVMWFLDSDICPPPHVLDLLTRYGDKWKAAGCPYPVFMTPPGEDIRKIVFTVYKGINGDSTKLAPCNVPHSGLDTVDGIATGCLFLKREVFDHLEKPYFEFKYDQESRMMTQGEDLGFCLKLAKLGIKFFVDYGMPCKHFKDNICLLEMNNYCLDFANKAVLQYDSSIRKVVEELAEKYKASVKENKELKEKLSFRQSLKI